MKTKPSKWLGFLILVFVNVSVRMNTYEKEKMGKNFLAYCGNPHDFFYGGLDSGAAV